MQVFIYGFSLGLSLILAIGAQNAFVLRQGLKGEHVFLICTICAVSDALLIFLGVSGFYVIIASYPEIEIIARYAGAAFLFYYGLRSFYSSWRTSHALMPDRQKGVTARSAVAITLALTWLNPHVYLDTVVLLGSVSTQYTDQISYFASGAITASFVFFYSLGYGAALLRPLFAQAVSWKILEFLIGVMMWMIALNLLLHR